ncbi:DNA polymerase I [Selenihalanaerobacter shriftii]|uniref:DNA polymerase I n=1 Tax=Selenihalanaerobacter shriftii TaxID=142842 RepID=A0A1T4KCS6_9FIRM|nr:DNA polymerase I [Selenihalanaerobacter shriftii]SJZ40244.1 DNA polymerase I [Selenihalanaerobacter shriftii]
MEKNDRLFLLDGNSLLHRAFYALPKTLQTSEGEYTNAVFGFTKMLLRLIEEEDPDALAVAFDLAAPTFRHKEYEEYKAQRKKTPDELSPQFDLIKEVLTAFKIPVLQLEGYEGDDIIGTLAQAGAQEGYQVTITTGDRDALQLVTEDIEIMYTKRGITNIVKYDLDKVREDYELEPKKLIDMKGLMGDKSDNIPGVDGIGEKTSTKLLHQFDSLEEVLDNIDQVSGKKRKERLREQGDRARMSKKLATIKLDVPIDYDLEEFTLVEPDQDKLVEVFSKLEFNTLLKEFGGYDTLSFSEDFELITDYSQLDKLINNLKEEKQIGFKFNFAETKLYQQKANGLTIVYNDQEAYYIDMKELEAKEVVKALKDYFEDEEVKKLSLDSKQNLLYLKELGVEVEGLDFDPLLAGYLLRPSNKKQDLEDLLTEYLKVELSEVDDEVEQETQLVRSLFKLKEKLIKDLKDKGLLELFVDVELPLIPVLVELELNGIAVDEDELERLSSKLQEKLDSICTKVYELSGEEFNLNSPKQLGEILFEKLGLPVIKRTKTGYSTSASVLEELEGKHEIIPLVLEYRQYQKLKSTYVDPLADLINHQTDRIHTSFNQMVTATGRLSSTEPNLQNIPIRTEEGREIRKVFVAEEGKKLLAVDYSQVELRVLAHISQDENLIEAYINNEDIHTKTAAEVFGVEAENVTYEQRRRAKAINFGIAYGISPWGLAKDIDVSNKEAEDYIDQYFNRYPKVKEYMDEKIQDAKDQGYVKTILNRRRYLPEINSSNYHRRSFAERMAINTPIQGSAADIMKLAMLAASTTLKERGLESEILLQVHDELVFEVPTEELEEVQQIMKEKMESVIELDVPLIVDLNVGKNWRDMEEVE